jgi:hypothetical protein
MPCHASTHSKIVATKFYIVLLVEKVSEPGEIVCSQSGLVSIGAGVTGIEILYSSFSGKSFRTG